METNPPNLSVPPLPPGGWGQPSNRSFNATPEKKSGFNWLGCGFLLAFLGIGVFLVFGLLGVVGKAIGTGLTTGGGGGELFGQIDERVVRKGSGDRIAHIDLQGVIMNSSGGSRPSMVEEFQLQMKKAVADRNVKAIVVRINSPGGEVTASDVLHHAIQEANREKPVIAYLDSIAASGGYYAACGARKILAHQTTLTGSIGVIIQSINYEELLGKVGVDMQVYKSGKFKDILSGSRAPTPEEQAYVQAMVRETYERFLEVVSGSRGKSTDDLRDSELADGRIYSGRQALATGMVDGLGFIEDAYNEAMAAAGVTGATVVRYQTMPGLLGALGLLGQSQANANRIELDVSSRLLPRLQPGVAYYLHLPAASDP